MNILDKMINYDNKCCGCSACWNICPKLAIDFKENSEGFEYPVIDKDKCIDCGICITVCPAINSQGKNNFKDEVFACANLNEQEQYNSSSGGVFTLLSKEVLNRSGVVYGAAFENAKVVKHIKIEREEDIAKIRGSKYLQSKMSSVYDSVKEDLELGKYVLFSGTPCQVGGIRNFLRKDYRKLLLVDFICHGVPSPLVWRKYIDEYEKIINNKIVLVNFRNKKNGWKNFNLCLKDASGKLFIEEHEKNVYMKGFLNELYLRPSCYNCSCKGTDRVSDITIGDFWGVDTIYPSFFDNRGISVLKVNSDLGYEFFCDIKKHMKYIKVDVNDVIKHNPAFVTSAKINKNRNKFFEELNSSNSIIDCINKYYLDVSLRKKISILLRKKVKDIFS